MNSRLEVETLFMAAFYFRRELQGTHCPMTASISPPAHSKSSRNFEVVYLETSEWHG